MERQQSLEKIICKSFSLARKIKQTTAKVIKCSKMNYICLEEHFFASTENFQKILIFRERETFSDSIGNSFLQGNGMFSNI